MAVFAVQPMLSYIFSAINIVNNIGSETKLAYLSKPYGKSQF